MKIMPYAFLLILSACASPEPVAAPVQPECLDCVTLSRRQLQEIVDEVLAEGKHRGSISCGNRT